MTEPDATEKGQQRGLGPYGPAVCIGNTLSRHVLALLVFIVVLRPIGPGGSAAPVVCW
ncbi:hypothetical protein A6P39_001040 [Streptomyces sp. FXJ1.172]|uniref:hypothetical protein n=1 Tax=Streptomyces sp. FXJ1.172 TaxID=710705 RepID=UPI001331A5A6|nr:hypothetical protein [Streptomyces sp. FXJ1.172]WEO92814.1 hypothetical protein A6P39_001040 [Streptomyces sp. FXJ1.172]